MTIESSRIGNGTDVDSYTPTDTNTLVGEEKTTSTDDPGPSDSQPDSKQSDLPDGGYGWVCVTCVALINAHTWGINSSYGVFLAHYLANNTFPGATSLEYAFVGGLSNSLALLMAPLATICTRKYGTKVSLSIGILFETAGLVGASWSTEIWHLFLSQGVAFGFGMGFLFVASVGVVPQWFDKKRSFANSIAAGGSGIGGMIYSLASNAMIQSIGLGWAFRILAIVAFVVNAICTILLRDRNATVGSVQLAFDTRLFKRGEYWLLLMWGFFSMLAYVVLLFSLPNYARTIGLTAAQGSVVGALLNLGQGVGRPFIGYFSDAFGRLNMAGTCTFIAGLFCLVFWIFAKTYAALIVFALVTGGVAGTFWATVGPVSVEVVGLQALPSALAIIWLFQVLPCTFAEPIGLELRATSGDIYLHAQLFTGFMFIAGALCMWFLRAWKVWEVSQMRLSKEQREQEIRDNDAVPRSISASHRSGNSLKLALSTMRGLWSWERV